MICCGADTLNGCLDLRCRAFPIDGHVISQSSRCPDCMARLARDGVAPLQRNAAGWMPTGIGRLSAGVGRRQPVTVCKAYLLTCSMKRVWALPQQAGAQYSAVEWNKAEVAVYNVVARFVSLSADGTILYATGVLPWNTAWPNARNQIGPQTTAACVKLCKVDNSLANHGRLAIYLFKIWTSRGHITSAPRVAHTCSMPWWRHTCHGSKIGHLT